MSDVLLERIAVALERIASNGTGTTAPVTAQPVTAQPVTAQPVTAQPVVATSTIDANMLLNLVQPLVQNEATKEQVKAVLVAHGLNRLGEAQESQYPSLWSQLSAIQAAPAQPEGLI